jgi:glycopeptide antibiotics resistance protein
VSGLFVLSVGVIAAATATPGYADSGRSLGFRFQTCMSYFPAEAFGSLFPTGIEGLLNVGLYVPAAVCGCLLTKRWYLVAVAGSALSFAVEVCQGLAGTRTCSGADWAHNTIGMVLGVLLGLAISRRRQLVPVWLKVLR